MYTTPDKQPALNVIWHNWKPFFDARLQIFFFSYLRLFVAAVVVSWLLLLRPQQSVGILRFGRFLVEFGSGLDYQRKEAD